MSPEGTLLKDRRGGGGGGGGGGGDIGQMIGRWNEIIAHKRANQSWGHEQKFEI
jgi:hypothetical protein